MIKYSPWQGHKITGNKEIISPQVEFHLIYATLCKIKYILYILQQFFFIKHTYVQIYHYLYRSTFFVPQYQELFPQFLIIKVS